MDDGEESGRGEGRLCTHAAPSVARTTCGSLVQTLALEPTCVPVAPRRLDLLYIPLDSSVTPTTTSCKLSHLGTCNTPPLEQPSLSPPLPPPSFRPCFVPPQPHLLRSSPPPSPFPRSSPIVRRAFFAYPFGAYVTEQIGDGESYVGPYLRLSRPMYRDREERRAAAHARVASGSQREVGGEGESLFAKLILE